MKKLMILGLIFVSFAAVANEFQYAGIVDPSDVKETLGGQGTSFHNNNDCRKTTFKIKGVTVATYDASINSQYYYRCDEPGRLSSGLPTQSNKKVFIGFPQSLGQDGFKRLYIIDLPKNNTFTAPGKQFIAIINPKMQELTFQDVGGILNRGGLVSVAINGKKVVTLDGFGTDSPMNVESFNKNTIEEEYNQTLLKITEEDGSIKPNKRILVSVNHHGLFVVTAFEI